MKWYNPLDWLAELIKACALLLNCWTAHLQAREEIRIRKRKETQMTAYAKCKMLHKLKVLPSNVMESIDEGVKVQNGDL